MPRLVILEWDEVELRALELKSSTAGSPVHRALTIELKTDSDEGPSTQVAAAINSLNFGKAEAVVCVGRSGCQLRTLNLPKVPHEELPELVRFQAMRHFSNFNQDSAVDYVVLRESADYGIEVLAAVISPELMKQVDETVEKANLVLKRIVLRPFAAASVVTGSLGETDCVLIIDRYAHEADLTVVRGKQVLTTRTIRLDSKQPAEEYAKKIRGEALRTIAAAKNQSANAEVTRIVLTGTEEDCAVLKEDLSKTVSLPVDIIEPFVASGNGNVKRPASPGRFTSLLGAVQQQFHESDHRVDFLNPRKKEEDHSGQRKLLFYAGLAAVSLAVLLIIAWLPIYFKGKQLDFMSRNVENMEKSNGSNQEFVAEVAVLDEWTDREVIVLDEIYYVSKNLPAPDRVIANSLHFRYPPRTENPTITMAGRMKGSETVGEIEAGLRDEEGVHKTSGKSVRQISGDKLYDHEFDETITIEESALPNRLNRKPPPVAITDLSEAEK